jgi:5'-deoxynucleotidase YfbR-like HD superfamily hydrolase
MEQLTQFLIQALRLAQVERGMLITMPRSFQFADADGRCWLFRAEDVAGHCWHSILVAIDLAPKVDEELKAKGRGPLDLLKVVKMLAVHDLGEIVLGDTIWPRPKPTDDEELAAVRKQVEGSTLGEKYADLVKEFQANGSDEAKFANAVDRIDACLVLLSTKDTKAAQSWKALRISYEKAQERWDPPRQKHRTLRGWSQFLDDLWDHALSEIGSSIGWPL